MLGHAYLRLFKSKKKREKNNGYKEPKNVFFFVVVRVQNIITENRKKKKWGLNVNVVFRDSYRIVSRIFVTIYQIIFYFFDQQKQYETNSTHCRRIINSLAKGSTILSYIFRMEKTSRLNRVVERNNDQASSKLLRK